MARPPRGTTRAVHRTATAAEPRRLGGRAPGGTGGVICGGVEPPPPLPPDTRTGGCVWGRGGGACGVPWGCPLPHRLWAVVMPRQPSHPWLLLNRAWDRRGLLYQRFVRADAGGHSYTVRTGAGGGGRAGGGSLPLPTSPPSALALALQNKCLGYAP